jgi:hypothetical protein
MAVKKSSKPGTTATKKGPTKAAPATKSAPKATPKAAADTATKTATPKATTKKPAVKVKVKKAPAIKLTDKQTEFLKSIKSAGEGGYKGDKKAEAKALEALLGKKLIKKGAKDKASGAYSYTISKAGEKHLSTPAPSTTS